MFEYDLILRDDEYEDLQIPVTLHTTDEIDYIEAGFVAVEMFCALDGRMNVLC